MSDIFIFLLLFPLLDITLTLSPGRDHSMLFAFVLLMIAFLVTHLIPENQLLFRLVILGLGIIELLILTRLYNRQDVLRLPSKALTGFVRVLVVFHLIVVSAGIIANIFGYVKWSRVAVESLVNNVLLGLVLFAFAVMLIGGFHVLLSGRYLQKFQVFRKHEDYLEGLITRLTIFGITLFWLDSILRIFYIRRPIYEFVRTLVTREYSLGSFKFSLIKIVIFVFILWLSVLISRVLKIVLRDGALDKLKLKKGVPRMIIAVAQFGAITLGILIAIRAIGMPLDQLTIIFSAFSVGIGFGLQNIFNNLVSGVILLFERPIQIGDTVEVGTMIGTVGSMGIRSSIIHTFDGAEVIVPNGQLISQEVVNWTYSDRMRRIEILAGVAYGSDVQLVYNLLMEAIKAHPQVKSQPVPLVLFQEMGDSALNFRLLFWTDRFEEWVRIRSEVVFKIYQSLQEHGVEIPFPQRDLHVRSVDPSVFGSMQKDGPTDK